MKLLPEDDSLPILFMPMLNVFVFEFIFHVMDKNFTLKKIEMEGQPSQRMLPQMHKAKLL